MVNVHIFIVTAYQRAQILDEMVIEFAASAYSTGHRDNLRTYAKKYQEFCTLLRLTPFPISESQLTRYIAYLTFTLKSPKSVQNYISGVKKLHSFARVQLPQFSGFVDIVIDGVKRVLEHTVTQAPPITPDMLKKISKLVNKRDHRQLVIFTAMLLAFYLFLRSSNYTSKTQSSFDPNKQLVRNDITVSGDMVLIHIKWSKTNQFKQRKLLIPLIKVASKSICPVTWLKYMINKIPAPKNAPAFVIPTRRGLLPLTYPQLNDQIKQWVSGIGLRGSKYSSHGLRRAGASWAYKVNISSLAIKFIGDWASQAYENYINYDIDNRLKAMIAFSKDL